MPNSPTEGNGWAISFATSAFDACIINGDPPGSTRTELDTSCLSTVSDMTSQPANLRKNGPITLTVQFDADYIPPLSAPAEQITITWPVPSGKTNGATWVFSGYMTAYEPQSVENDSLITAQITIAVSGGITRNPAT